MKKWNTKGKVLWIERVKVELPGKIQQVIQTEDVLVVLLDFESYDQGNLFGVGYDGLIKWQIAPEAKPVGWGNDVVTELFEADGKIRVCYMSGLSAYLNACDGSVVMTGERPW